MGWLLARTTTATTLGFLWILPLSSPAVAETTQPPGNDKGFDFFDLQFPGAATRVMFYVLVGIIIVFAGTLIGLVVYRGRADSESGFSRSRS